MRLASKHDYEVVEMMITLLLLQRKKEIDVNTSFCEGTRSVNWEK
jgi:hypothetical protein